VLAELARGRLRAKLPALQRALEGRFSAHHALLCSHILAHLDYLDEAIESLSEEIDRRTRPFARELEQLDTITGVGKRAAESILAELGPDMSRSPPIATAPAGPGSAPATTKSAGKRRSGKTGQGNPWLREIPIECARAAARSNDTHLKAQYLHLRRRRGDSKAIVAVAHSILVSAYHILNNTEPYRDLGFDHFQRREHPDHTVHPLTRQLEQLGRRVTLEPLPT
jgi:transposase